MRPFCMEKDGSKERGGRNLTGFNRRATLLGGMQQPSNPVAILARTLSGERCLPPYLLSGDEGTMAA